MEGSDEGWLVLQSNHSDEWDCGETWMAATYFRAKGDAVAFVEHVIRDEWMVVVDADTERPQRLSDLRGYYYPKSSIKWSQAYFSGDGDEAWARADGGATYKIKIVPMKKEGERTC